MKITKMQACVLILLLAISGCAGPTRYIPESTGSLAKTERVRLLVPSVMLKMTVDGVRVGSGFSWTGYDDWNVYLEPGIHEIAYESYKGYRCHARHTDGGPVAGGWETPGYITDICYDKSVVSRKYEFLAGHTYYWNKRGFLIDKTAHVKVKQLEE